MNDAAATSLDILMEGNERFRTGRGGAQRYSTERIAEIGAGGPALAAIVGCVDSRVAPEVLFDQALQNLFVSRSPGNAPSEGAIWTAEMAVAMAVPLIIVLGHTNCLAIGSVVDEDAPREGLRGEIRRAMLEARAASPDDLYGATIRANALRTASELTRRSPSVEGAVKSGDLAVVAAIYDVHTGRVERLDAR